MGTNDQEPDIARRAHLLQAQWEALLRACLNPSESVVAHRAAVMVTDRRVLFAWNAQPFGWRSEAISFEEITRWSLGRRHDERPLLRIEHPDACPNGTGGSPSRPSVLLG